MVQSALKLASPLNIVCVDDDIQMLGVFQRLLSRLGHQVKGYASPIKAIYEVSRDGWPLDLLITDVNMPDLEGHILAERFRSAKPSIPIIFTTGYHDAIKKLAISPARGRFLLAKPFDKDSLVDILSQAAEWRA